MSQQNVEVVHRAIEANRSDDLEAAVEALVALSDPSIEYTSVMAALESRTYVPDAFAARWPQWYPLATR